MSDFLYMTIIITSGEVNSGVPHVEIGISVSSAKSFARPKSIILIFRFSLSGSTKTILFGFKSTL